jgi:hypothetical protein
MTAEYSNSTTRDIMRNGWREIVENLKTELIKVSGKLLLTWAP